MKTRGNIVLGICLLAIIGTLAVGCAPAAAPTEEPAGGREAQEAPEFTEEATEAPAEYYDEEESAATEEPVAVSGEGVSEDQLVAQLPQERMIVKNGEIDLLVEDTDSAINRVTQVATDNGGYVLSSQSWYSREFKYATITLAVRADRFETAMERLRGLSIQVLSETSSGEDVTSEYVDLNSRLSNLEATRDRIQGFLDEAKNVDEALKINQQLSDIEAEIEQVKGRMTYLSGRSAFSTITVDLTPPEPTPTPTMTPTATPTKTPSPTPTEWSPGVTVKQATKTQTRLFQGLVEALLWLVIVPGPYLLGLGIVLAGARWYVTRNNDRKGGPKGGASTGGSATP